MAGVKGFVDAKIAEKKIVMFSKSYCPYCTKAKKYLKIHLDNKEFGADDYMVIEIENNPDCGAIQDYLQKLTGGRSVPRVFINGKCIGGGDETEAAHKNGQLSALVKA